MNPPLTLAVMAIAALSWLESVPEAFSVFHFCNISLKDLYLNDKMFSIFDPQICQKPKYDFSGIDPQETVCGRY